MAGGGLAVIVTIGLLLGTWLWRVEYRAASELALRNAELVAKFTQQVLGTQVRLLQQADNYATPELVSSDPEAVSAYFAELIAGDIYAIGLGLVSADGQFLVTSQLASAQVDARDRAYFRALRDNDWPLFVDRIVVEPGGFDALVVAQRRDGDGFHGLLVAALHAAVLADFLRTLADLDGAAATIVRTDGTLLLRHELADRPMLIQENASIHDTMAGGGRDVYQATPEVDGVTRLYAAVPVAGFPLYAVFGSPMTALWAAWRERMTLAGVSLAVVAALGLLLTAELRRRRQEQLSASLLEGARRETERQAILFNELNHRTKNNLQLVESLIRLKGRDLDPELRKIMGETAARVGAISRVHQQLEVAQETGAIDLAALLHALASNPGLVPPERGIEVRCDAASLQVSVDRAVPLALIVVEALSNALKHAFPENRRGRVRIILRQQGGTIRLTVADDGIGIRREPVRRTSLGHELIEALAHQLGGTVTVRSKPGVELTVTFPAVAAASAA